MDTDKTTAAREMDDEERADKASLFHFNEVMDGLRANPEGHYKLGYLAGLREGRRLEREECAKVCEAGEQFLKPCCLHETQENARVIRARGGRA